MSWSQSFCSLGLNGLHGETLVGPCLACVALATTSARLPLVFASDPGLATLQNEPLLVLFGRMSGMSDWFLMEIVLWVFVVDLLQSGGCTAVHLHMALVQCVLPCFSVVVIDGVCPLPSCQCCVSLPLAEVRLIGRCIWRTLVLADVERFDPSVWRPNQPNQDPDDPTKRRKTETTNCQAARQCG